MDAINLHISSSVLDGALANGLSESEAEEDLLDGYTLGDNSNCFIDTSVSNLYRRNSSNMLEDSYYSKFWDAWILYIPVEKELTNQGVEGFVNRCYTVILGRDPEPAGKANWINALNNERSCGAQVAHSFIFSQEYLNKKKNNTDYVTDLYLMFFGRNPDSAGLQNWLNQLNAGVMDREQVFIYFAKSTEFKNICNDYGILQGCYIPGYSTESQTKVNLFVYRLYKFCFGRNADISGLENWSRNILAGNVSGYSAAMGFFNSQEYKNLNKSSEEFIKDLYSVMMNRRADPDGLSFMEKCIMKPN